MPQTTYKGYEVQSTGSNSGTWGTVLNDNMITYVDYNIGRPTTLSLASTTPVALTADEARSGMLIFTGGLLANIAVTTTALGAFWVENRTSGNFYVSLSNGVGNAMLVPQGTGRQVWSDATYGVRALNLPPPGTFMDLGGETPHPSLLATTSLVGEYLLCDGSSFLTTGVTANLYAAIGTSWGAGPLLPDLRGRARFGKNNMGGSDAGRITLAGSGINGNTVGAVGGAQNVTLGDTNMPASYGSHAHGSNYTTSTTTVQTIGANTTNITYVTTIGAGGNGFFTQAASISGNATVVNNMTPTGICNVLIKI